MGTPFLSQIELFAFNFPPKGWAFCNGQILPINQNQALFSLLGTTYGGNGVTTFALPNLQGRVPLGFGPGPGLSNYTLGQAGGTETIALISTQLPQHSHTIDASALTATPKCSNGVSDQRTPVGNVPAVEAAGVTATYSNGAPDANMNGAALVMGGAVSVANTGSGQGHENRQPHLALTYCIALTGIFPSQN